MNRIHWDWCFSPAKLWGDSYMATSTTFRSPGSTSCVTIDFRGIFPYWKPYLLRSFQKCCRGPLKALLDYDEGLYWQACHWATCRAVAGHLWFSYWVLKFLDLSWRITFWVEQFAMSVWSTFTHDGSWLLWFYTGGWISNDQPWPGALNDFVMTRGWVQSWKQRRWRSIWASALRSFSLLARRLAGCLNNWLSVIGLQVLDGSYIVWSLDNSIQLTAVNRYESSRPGW